MLNEVKLLPCEREAQLQEIGNILAHWLKWVTREHEAQGLEVTADTHVMLSIENAPPKWPTIGQLKCWLEVIRADPRPTIVTDEVVELKEWAFEKSRLHHQLAHENEALRTEHIASSTAYRELALEIEARRKALAAMPAIVGGE